MQYLSFTAIFAAGALSFSFEPENFNATAALLSKGVKPATLPKVAPLGKPSNSTQCAEACNSLKQIFGANQLETPSQSAYATFLTKFWSSQQSAISPKCVFKPQNAEDVSTAVLIARITECPFAARSGGHSAVPGGSNIEGGITISFEKLNKIEISRDRTRVALGPGHTWLEVYQALEPHNLTVIGARATSVGVGGLTLGGGISYFSSQYGMACDNVESYELVTARGKIINVSEHSYPDLYWALRGGGNNFGLVTQFNVAAIPRAPTMWGGRRIFTDASFPALINAYYNLGMSAKKDGKAHQILSFANFGGLQLAVTELEYADPNANASVMAEYNSIQGALQETIGINSLANITIGMSTQAGPTQRRQAFWTWTSKLDKGLATGAKDVFFAEIQSILGASDLLPTISFQVLTEPILEKTAARGGNALGLNPKGGPLLLGEIGMSWSNKADDERINKVAATIVKRNIDASIAAGKASSYLYMNYASPWQDPIAGYGSANKARLQAISHKYDPAAVFQKLQPGYFKLAGPPNKGSL